ncbi:MAG: radical SAM protein [Alphaproteobacteria bacterium]|nr:radical SAM protein [Alphaproteobacteria bacterium]
MFPVLVDCRVRGAADDVYLHNFKKGHEYTIEKRHAQILNLCDGTHSLEDIASAVSTSIEEIKEFLDVFKAENLLRYNDSQIDPIHISWLNRDPFLREVHIDITGTCNLFGHCKHCYGRSNLEESHKSELSTEEVLDLIDQMGSMGVADCVISGGEPFLRKDLPLIIKRLSDNSIHFIGLFTNGTTYRQDVIDALKKENYTTFFFISLDGYTQEMHEFLRGKDTFAKTIDFINRVDKEGFPVIINTMVTKHNVKSLMDFCHFLEQKNINRWRLSVPREQGETIFHKDIIMPEWEDVFKSYKELLEYCLVKKSRMKVQIGSIFKSELLNEPEYYLYNDCNSCCEYKRWSIVVKPNGNVTPCTAFDNLVFGNIRQNSLADIWYSEPTQMFKTLPLGKTDCKDCKIRQYCGGGCRKMAWELHRSCLAKDDTSCPLYEFAAQVAQPILKKFGIKDLKLKEVPEQNFDYQKLEEYIK